MLDGTPYLVTGARRPNGGPAFYFLFDAAGTEAAIAQLGQALLVGGLVLTGLAALAAGFLARGILRPVRDASRAAGASRPETCPRACRSIRATSSGRGRRRSTGWLRRWNGPWGSGWRRTSSARSSPTCRTSCAPR